MSKSALFAINILIYWVVVTGLNVLSAGSFGTITALLLGGIIFAIFAVLVEPLLGFFKFPVNFWGLLVVGFLINLAFFAFMSTGLLPSILKLSPGTFGQELSPIPFFRIVLNNVFVVALFAAFVSTLMQILFRKLSN